MRQAGRIERFHGVRMATARVLLRYAMVPGTWWPFATHHSNLLHNMLPNSASRSPDPLAILRHRMTSWKNEHVSVFGHFAMVWLAPPQRDETAKQLADRWLMPKVLKIGSTNASLQRSLVSKLLRLFLDG